MKKGGCLPREDSVDAERKGNDVRIRRGKKKLVYVRDVRRVEL